jgi:hypothetical protein
VLILREKETKRLVGKEGGREGGSVVSRATTKGKPVHAKAAGAAEEKEDAAIAATWRRRLI